MKRKNYQRGTDSVPARLTPREAVLNVNAAELLGRHNIAALNAHGNMLADRGVNLASLPSDPTPGPSTENMLGYETGTADVRRDDRGDLLRDAENTFYGGGHVPAPSPTPKPVRGYAYGTDNVRRNMRTTDRYYRGINMSRGASPNAITSMPQGQTIQFSGSSTPTRSGGGFGPNNGLLSPDQNPAYQAAIARNPTPASMRAGGSGAGAYSWITTPSGGQMRVPTGSLGALLNTGSLKGSQVTQIGNQAPIDYAAEKAKGFGAPNPTIVGVGAPDQAYQKSGGVYNPIENLTPKQRVAGGVGGTLDNIITNPSLNVASNFLTNAASRVASAVGNFFGGGNNNTVGPSFPPSTGATAPSPTPTPYQTPNPVAPSPTPTPTPPPQQPFNTDNDQNLVGYQRGTANVMPRRYSDYY